MKSWESALIGPDISLREALEIIDSAGTQLAVVVDGQRRLLGTVSDGDARRALLSGLGMDDLVSRVMHANPTTVLDTATPHEIQSTMRRTGLHQLPYYRAQRCICRRSHRRMDVRLRRVPGGLPFQSAAGIPA